MSPLKRSNNIAARMGRWSASHWKTAVFGWLAFVVAALAIGSVVGTKQIDDADVNVGQSHKADQILDKGFPQADPQTEVVLIRSTNRIAESPEYRAVIGEVVSAVEGNPAVRNIQSPLAPGNEAQISQDRTAVMVTWDMKDEYDEATKKIDAIEAAVTKVGDRHPEFSLGEAGAISSGKALDEMFTTSSSRPASGRSRSRSSCCCSSSAHSSPSACRYSSPSREWRQRSGSSHCRARSSRWTRTSQP